MLNHITIMGRLVADPELRTTPDGISVCTIRIACDRDYKSKKSGERETDFINVVAWKSTAEFISRNFSRGRMIVADGRLQVRPYTDRDGNKRTSAEVVADHVYFSDSRPADNTDSTPAYAGDSGQFHEPDDGPINDDDFPF